MRVASIVCVCLATESCGRVDGARAEATEAVVVRGSDTMLPLLQRWAAMAARGAHPLRVQVTGGGSGTGLRALADGTADVAAASREIEPEEREAVRARGLGDVVAAVVALDAVALYVNPSSGVRAITLSDVASLYLGAVDRWSSLGGADIPVALYGRESSSGTYAFFKERVLRDAPFAAEVQNLPGTASVLQAVARDRGAVGYAGLGGASEARPLALRPPDGGAPVAPDVDAVRSRRYPLARALYLYTAGVPTGAARRWLDAIGSPAGQREVALAGFVPAHEGASP